MCEIGLEIKNLNNVICRYFSNLKSIAILDEITGFNGYILSFLNQHSNEIITQKKIEEILGITRSTTSTILSRMEKNGLVVRKKLSSDTRVKQILLTDKGREIDNSVRQDIKIFEKKLIKGFNEEELQQLLDFFKRIKNNVMEEEI